MRVEYSTFIRLELFITIPILLISCLMVTDHQDVHITGAEFGFATPVSYRQLLGCVTEGVVIVYPPRTTAEGSDEGCEFSIAYEKRLARTLIEDPEWCEYFEYRGVDAEEFVSNGV
ncbi:hypothetical protein FE257_005412 [Aspergillus nanangensis]|uniref:Uncharacterized protein n=1 Tax=Aspergillus nanangensis TaxID=2582783 RepID=A0AAD4CQP8_ASPNN|nr:hypothetical protein FE257_005412 [Aspergillus nanangensis]